MALPELSASDVNLMVSEALCYSQRLTKPLSLIVHHKTTGNPFFVKELLNDLTIENLLVFSFSQNMWEWDEEMIESRTISDGVAEILIKKAATATKGSTNRIIDDVLLRFGGLFGGARISQGLVRQL
jgi:predicted ATPase